jgi:outer membrane receptor for ferrienterochelin and colicin
MRKLFTTILSVLLLTSVYAQQDSLITVKGSVLDSANAQPVEFANIVLLDKSTGKAIKNTMTDSLGNYILTGVVSKVYSVSATSLGYTSKVIVLDLSAHSGIFNAQTIYLKASGGVLNEVVVRATRPLVEQSDDGVIYNAEDDPGSKASTAIDVLRKTPFVTVDGDNNIQVNGGNNFKVLLNGRETAMFSRNVKEALLGFPGSLIVKVEVITSPSAKYDAEGVGGIINIITRKKIDGHNGSVNSYYSTLSNYVLSGNLNAKQGKVGISANASTQGSFDMITSSMISRTTTLGNSFYSNRILDGERNRKNLSNMASLELSLETDTLNTFSLYGNIRRNKAIWDMNQQVTTLLGSGTDLSRLSQETNAIAPAGSFGLDYFRRARRHKTEELSFRMNGSLNSINSEDASSQVGSSQRYLLNTNQADNAEYTVQSDYIKPIGATKLETGVKAIIRNATSDYLSLVRYDLNDEFTPNQANTDYFDYRQQVYSAYGSYSFKVKDLAFRTGLRYEYTNIDGNFVTSNATVAQQYDNLIPNLQVTRNWTKKYSTVLNYSIGLQRPYITNLNPFINNTDSLNISYGNPDLQPQTVHTFSLQNRFIGAKVFATITLNAFASNNIIVQYARFDPTTGITSTTSDNLGRERQLTLSANFSVTASKKLSLWLNGLTRYNNTRNTSGSTPDAESISFNLYTGGNYRLSDIFTISWNGGVTQTPNTLLGKGVFFGFYQANFGYTLIKDKLSGTVNFNNMHSTYQNMKNIVENQNFRTVTSNINPYRVIYFGWTYRFGALKENVSKKKGVTNDDLLN